MRHVVLLGVVAFFAMAGLLLVSPERPSAQGASQLGAASDDFGAAAPYHRLQSPQPLYKDMFYRCQENSYDDVDRCYSAYDEELANCKYEMACRAKTHLNNCVMTALASWRNCARYRRNVLHNLSYQ